MRRLFLVLILVAAPLMAQPEPFTVSPTSLSFGNQAVGTTSPSPQSFTVSMPAGTTAVFTLEFSVSSSNSAFAPSATSFSLLSGQSRTVNVSFTPNIIGLITGTIRVSASVKGDPVGSPVDVSASGTGTASVTVAPSPLHLGSVLLGCSNSRSLQVTTTALLDFDITSTNPVFATSPTSFSTASSRNVAVSFTPTAIGPTSTILTVTGSTRGDPVQRHNVTGDGVGFDLALNPATLDFGPIPVGVASAPRTVAFSTTPATATGFAISAVSSSRAFSASVSPSGLASITFTPSAEGAADAVITLTFVRQDEAVSPCTVTRRVAVRGSGTQLNITANPGSVDLGRVILGSTSSARSTSVTNGTDFNFTGTAAVDNATFSITPATFSLGGRRSQDFSLTFRPAAAGPASGVLTLTLTSTGTATAPFGTTVTVTLTGEGLNPAAITISPPTVDFGDVSVGSSALRSVTVTNTGDVSSAVSTSSSNPAFSVAPSSFTLAGGASQAVNISFSPTAAGTLQSTATFSITGSSRAVALTGRGVSANYTYQVGTSPISPGGAVPFPATTVGATSDFVPFEIRNTGTGAATINSIGSSSGAFMLDQLPALPAVVVVGGSLSFRIAFRPASPGPTTGALNIDGRSFSLSGNGVLSGVTFTGAGTTLQPATQPMVGLTLPGSYPVPVTGQLVLTFAANAAGAPDDPAIQFSGGGRTVNFTVPANSSTAQFGNVSQIGFQSGTVAGSINLRVTLQAGGIDVTPTPTPTRAFTVGRGAPVIRSLALANRTATAFSAVIVAYAVTREINSVDVAFAPSGTGSLQTTSLQVDVGARFATWYGSADAAPHGGLFTLTIPFTVQGDIAALRSITVTLRNGDGASQPMSANF